VAQSGIKQFIHDGQTFACVDTATGEGAPVLLIHGFASNMRVNWVDTGWVQTLSQAGRRVVALDNRGHGQSSKPHEATEYTPEKMAADAVGLLDHLEIARAHVIGYSMGARIAAFMALGYPGRVATLILGGLGEGMVTGVGDWDPIAAALLADDPAAIAHPRGQMFRAFADKTGSDCLALAACIASSRTLLSPEQMRAIAAPALVAVGTKDDIAGDPQALAAMMTDAVALDIPGRDHMLAVGDKVFKNAVLAFLDGRD
jgi:pimeloyl-ACP methyl ester carboxylesterase